jgi:DNA-binding NtrC family response regulator
LPREVVPAAQQAAIEIHPDAAAATDIDDDSDRLDDLQRAHIVAVLERERGNKAKAARILGIHRRKLYRLLERYGIGRGEQ